MCGIFGMIGEASDGALDAARAALQRRGPDSSGAFRDGDVGLAHTRLQVIDLSAAAAQPMAGCTPAVQVTYNGEIYNHHALRAQLETRGHRFRSRADTEVIVHGWEEWGPAVVEKLDGMFALAVWDARTRTLLLARDRTGKKPLTYARTPRGSLWFASEPKALFAAGLPDAIDVRALPMLLAWGYVPPPSTLHEGVAQLGPAQRLVWRSGQEPQIDTYWRPTFADEPLAISFAESTRRVRELVIAAVERRLESDVPLGAFLSGGLDSTIVVGVMAKLYGRRVRTFSIGFAGDARFDETHFARMAASAFGTDHTTFEVQPSSVQLVEELVQLHDGPFADSSAIPTYTISKLMREHVTVALSGDGGDELFCGYLRFLAAEAAEKIPPAVRRSLRRLGALLPGALPHHSLGARARRFFAGADLPLADRIARWNSIFAFDTQGLLRPELGRTLDLSTPLAWHRAHVDGRGSVLKRLLDDNFQTYLANDLQQKVDRCSAGNGLEVRSPLLDTQLIEFAGRLPDGHLRRGRETKRVLRAAFHDLVPEPIRRRGKMGFGVPLATWFRGELHGYLRDHLSPQAALHEYLDPAATRRLLDEHETKKADRSAQLWTLLTLEVWLRSLASNRSLQNRARGARGAAQGGP